MKMASCKVWQIGLFQHLPIHFLGRPNKTLLVEHISDLKLHSHLELSEGEKKKNA